MRAKWRRCAASYIYNYIYMAMTINPCGIVTAEVVKEDVHGHLRQGLREMDPEGHNHC